MKIKQLIESLETFDPEMIVCSRDTDYTEEANGVLEYTGPYYYRNEDLKYEVFDGPYVLISG